MNQRFETLGVVDIAALVRSRQVSARQVTEACFARIAAIDGDLHAFVTLDAAGALVAADDIDRRMASGDDPGPLAGAPVGIKDLLFTANLRTTFGSAHFRNFVPRQDDIAVARLRAAGAVVIGKTNTSEFGYGPVPRNALFPATRNPWNRALGPAGSSSGSAAGVAAGLVPLALGSDGGGSIRVPAAMTGVVGFKPTFGRVPVYPGCRDDRLPGVSSWESLEHIGPMARSVADIVAAFAVLAGPDVCDRHSLPREGAARARTSVWRMAYSPDLGFANVDEEVARLCEQAARDLGEALGATFHFATPGAGDVQDVFEALVALDTDFEGLLAMRAASGVPFGAALTTLLEREPPAASLIAAGFARKRVTNQMAAFMADWDLLATPSTAVAAFPLEWDAPPTIAGRPARPTDFAPFSALANLTGQPAITLPVGLTADGRPVGLQILARRLADAELLEAAAAFERARPFPRFLDKSRGSSELRGESPGEDA